MKKIVFGSCLLLLAACGGEEIVPEESPAVRTECSCDELVQIEAYNKYHIVGSETPFTGTCQLFHKNDSLAEERIYADGKIEGHVRRWHNNGQMASEAFFKKNRQTGIAKQWDESGTMTYHGSYENGKLIEQLPLEN